MGGARRSTNSEKAEKMEAPGLRRNATGATAAAAADNPGGAQRSPPASVASDAGSEAATDEQPPDWPGGGLPVVLLWLPYTALTALLLGLMVASFVRFHKKRLRKFEARKEQLWRQLDVQEFLLHQQLRGDDQTPPPPNGNLFPSTALLPHRLLPSTPDDDDDDKSQGHRGGGGKERHRRRYSLGISDGHLGPIINRTTLNHSMPQSHQNIRPTTRHIGDFGDASLSCFVDQRRPGGASSIRWEKKGLHPLQSRRRLPLPPTTDDGPRGRLFSSLPKRPLAERNDDDRKRRNTVVFITNINGSMVNLRCGEPDSLDPFQGRRCFWSTKNSEMGRPIRGRLIDVSCLRHPIQRPEIWTTTFNYNHESIGYD